MTDRWWAVLVATAVVLCAHANAVERGLDLETESQAEFASIVKDLRANVFLDTTQDASLGKSLKENLQGPQGIQGLPGPKGLTGPQGNQGLQGPAGQQGVAGPTGQAGPAGPQGPRGLTGGKGPAGMEGPMGPVGNRGDVGVSGQKGAPGPEGPPGPAGFKGDKGFQGPVGADGPRGYTGAIGPQGFHGPPGPAGTQGEPGPKGAIGKAGETGPSGKAGETGPAGIVGYKGPVGEQGPAGPPGARGLIGAQGTQGQVGPAGAQGPRGVTGPQGLIGEAGPRGVKGDQGPRGPPGAAGPVGPQGERGLKGASGPSGSAGPPGPVGTSGASGEKGPRGAEGPLGPKGPAGPRGLDGSLKKYSLTGSRRFMLQGGENANVAAKIYSGQENDAPILFFETERTPASLSMYQTKERQKVASINGFYGNIGIGETNPTTKLQVKGQVLLSHNFNNVVSAKEKRGAAEVQFDIIGTYWGMDKSSVYIGAYTGEKKAGYHAEKVIFGGSTNEPKGKAHVDLNNGKIYAEGFVTNSALSEESEAMTDLEAETLIQVSSKKELDLGRSTKYLHRKVRDQAATIDRLEQQLAEMKRLME